MLFEGSLFMRKVELLAPAGNYECFLAALCAGADAVYLGGTKFGARAYADNFSEEEICRAISVAHLWNRKIYLTLNTLLKEKEIEEVMDYVRPLYESGLDGVIVQDLGVFQILKAHFPGLALHCSTQMTITGEYGAAFAKEMGASRIVPARELSLAEIKKIQESVDIEIESFIHGAMCYCYSGQCLFSSILGGRSGNRGKCAQPCRLPYKTNRNAKTECYPLSLKDMCTIDHIPELIEAQIASFKIEGRMKKAEYVAGVTGIYRKYIDMYYANPHKEWKIEEEDRRILNSLYIRSQVQNGYYFRHNGKEMITLQQPGYSGNDEAVLKKIRNKYMTGKMQIPAEISCCFQLNRSASLQLTAEGQTVTVEGMEVMPAKSMPVTEENIRTQISKFGNTDFYCSKITVTADDNIFYPIKAINELRRIGVEKLEQAILKKNCPSVKNRQFIHSCSGIISGTEQTIKLEKGRVFVVVSTYSQLCALLESSYGDAWILDTSVRNSGKDWDSILKLLWGRKKQIPVYFAAPYIIRRKDRLFLEELLGVLNQELISGCLFRNLETYYFLKEKQYQKELIADANLYVFNTQTYAFWNKEGVTVTLPYELNAGEIRQLKEKGVWGIKTVYGRIPMMITANCIQKTMNGCSGKPSECALTDRYRNSFPVISECRHCYNIIYNTLPLSLHKSYAKLLGQTDCRLVFTTESREDTMKVIRFYEALTKGNMQNAVCPYRDYTTGHEKRGVE